MTFAEGMLLVLVASLILVLIFTGAAFVSHWLDRKERAARLRGKAPTLADGDQREPPPRPRPGEKAP
jgi:hypothetical protein